MQSNSFNVADPVLQRPTRTPALSIDIIMLPFITYTAAVFNHTIGCIAQQEDQPKCLEEPDAAGIMA
jgi:hypothetical protein